MIKLKTPDNDEETVSGLLDSELWRSVEAAEQLVNAALPALKCPICGNSDSFTLQRDFSERSSPQIFSYRWKQPNPDAFVPTLAISCNECGHYLFFAEQDLIDRGKRMK